MVYSDQNGAYADTLPSVPEGIPISVASYDCQNVLHSNTVFSSSVPIQVDFHMCVNTQCHAGFTFVLDSNNSVQNTFLFSDQSYGNPNQWIWSFGDGTSSNEKYPSHHYTTQGTYHVYLTIIREDSSGAWICSDTISQFVTTVSYYNIGGLLFIGQFPINNPHNTGDTGVVYLYRKHNDWIVPVDTSYFTYLGYYTFLHVLEGSYIIKACLTKGSVHFNDYIPVYTGDVEKWQASAPFVLNQNSFYNDLHLICVNDSLSGSAMMKGIVMHMGDNQKLAGVEVLLYTEDMKTIKYAMTDSQGAFEFSGLPFGAYNLYPEITGKYAKVLMVTVDSAHLIVDGLQLDVYDHELTGISPNPGKSEVQVGNVFPNPASDFIYFKTDSPADLKIQAELLAFTGVKLYQRSFVLIKGSNLIAIPFHSITDGIYLLVIRNENGNIIKMQKVIKN